MFPQVDSSVCGLGPTSEERLPSCADTVRQPVQPAGGLSSANPDLRRRKAICCVETGTLPRRPCDQLL